MRFLIAMMKHETNTFSPIPTDLQRFRDWGLHEGEAVVKAYKGTNHPLAAFLDLHGAMAAEGEPDGEGGLLERMRQIAPNLPIAVCFDMHGNMSERIVA